MFHNHFSTGHPVAQATSQEVQSLLRNWQLREDKAEAASYGARKPWGLQRWGKFQGSNIFGGFPPGKFHIFGTPTMVLVELFLGENDKPKKMMNGRWVTGFTWLDYGQTLRYLERLFGIRWVYRTSNTSAKQYI